jgi:hypothetical protein
LFPAVAWCSALVFAVLFAPGYVGSVHGQVEPSYLVERVIDAGGVTRRLSVFRDGQVVLVRRQGAEDPDVRRMALSSPELRVMLQLVEEVHADIRRGRPPATAVGQARLEYRLAPPGQEPVTVVQSLAGVGSAGTVRLGRAVDALETRLAEARLDQEDTGDWQPKVGDRVELYDGSRVEVVEVLAHREPAVVRVAVLGTPTLVYWERDELRRQTLRRLPRP